MTSEQAKDMDHEIERFAAVALAINAILEAHGLSLSAEGGCLVDDNGIGNTGFVIGEKTS